MKYVAILSCFLYGLLLSAQELDIQLFAQNLDRPVTIKHAGDDKLYVVEQDGYIKIVNADGTIETAPFLNIDSQVINTGNERGLLGLAFHPNYTSNGFFYVNYINNSGNTVIARFNRSTTNPLLADPNSELIILTYSQPFSNHNGGDMAFGPDGYLYISSGDGGSGGDPLNNSQNLTNLLGKILRIDVDNTEDGNNYAIPSDNPFKDSPTNSEEIWGYGLRNPWKFSFDSLNGDIWIADVGQQEYEEINKASISDAGLNYGWRCYEGNATYNTSGCPNPNTLTYPVAEYNHSSNGLFKCSITGGYRYQGSTYANFNGLYFFADYCSGEIGYLTENGPNWDMTLTDFSGNWVAFGEDVNGELYISDITTGNIYKLVDNLLSTEEFELDQLKIYPNPTSELLNINFSGLAQNELITISLIDIQGKKVKTVIQENASILQLNITDILEGIYILELRSNIGEIKNYKVIIN
ncbi:PQQ-dependent sugar dehydrogenase [Winogradskyella alexanderae]|uniref:PQQ-dependent sugar dehydrogenase n=1 Tax=Winogradskyella alexanderae TaxID=2877123 RepID=A0ABS7XSP7_9FLAO|nr:PQQ-dependent sugar dehydrogenase [Winogradskyella alexanderae]MCA0133055.1 PQQ-dependent sugar dehydrogenase [Winogradskyella alexanderae]